MHNSKLKRFDNELIARCMVNCSGFQKNSAYYVLNGGTSRGDLKLWNEFIQDRCEFVEEYPNYMDYLLK